MINPQVVAEKIQNLPTLGSTIAQLTSLLKDENAGADAFEQVIKPDPAMTANLLKFANSGYFANRGEVKTVKQAIVALGTKRIFEIVASEAFSKVIPDNLEGYDLNAMGFWRHSVATAIIGEQLSKSFSEVTELAFTAGLLHDVGKLVMSQFLEDQKSDLLESIQAGTTFISFETDFLGVSHTVIGRELALKWNLPEAICDTCEWHHYPSKYVGPHQKLVDIIHVSDIIAHQFGLGADIGELARRLDLNAVKRLGLDVGKVEQNIALVLNEIRELCNAFKVGRK